MDAIEIADGEVSFEYGIIETHVLGTTVTCPCVHSIVNCGVVEFVTVDFFAGFTVDNGDIERRQFGAFIAIIHDSIAICVGTAASVCILTPGVVGLVPEACTVGTAYHHFASSVAVDVVCHDHVVLSTTYIYIRTYIHGPEQSAVETVCLNLMTGSENDIVVTIRIYITGSCIESVNHYGIYFPVSIEVHRPYEFSAVVVSCDYVVVEIELKPCIRPHRSGVEIWFAFITFNTVNHR